MKVNRIFLLILFSIVLYEFSESLSKKQQEKCDLHGCAADWLEQQMNSSLNLSELHEKCKGNNWKKYKSLKKIVSGIWRIEQVVEIFHYREYKCYKEKKISEQETCKLFGCAKKWAQNTGNSKDVGPLYAKCSGIHWLKFNIIGNWFNSKASTEDLVNFFEIDSLQCIANIQLRDEKTCEVYQCAHEWVNQVKVPHNFTSLYENCPGKQWLQMTEIKKWINGELSSSLVANKFLHNGWKCYKVKDLSKEEKCKIHKCAYDFVKTLNDTGRVAELQTLCPGPNWIRKKAVREWLFETNTQQRVIDNFLLHSLACYQDKEGEIGIDKKCELYTCALEQIKLGLNVSEHYNFQNFSQLFNLCPGGIRWTKYKVVKNWVNNERESGINNVTKLLENYVYQCENRKTRAEECDIYACAYDWVQNSTVENVTLLYNQCTGIDWLQFNKVEKWMNGTLPKSFIAYNFEISSLWVCPHRFCSFSGFASYQKVLIQAQYYYTVLFEEIDVARFSSIKRSHLQMRLVNLIFSFISAPLTILFNTVNLSTLNLMLKDEPGGSLYLHFAEIISDMLVTIFNVIDGLRIDETIAALCECLTGIEVNRITTVLLVKELRMGCLLTNQWLLVALLIDRIVAIKIPFSYNNFNHKKRARWAIFATFFGCLTLQMGRFLLIWNTKTTNSTKLVRDKEFELYSSHISIISVNVQIFVPFCLQIVTGLFLNWTYKKWLRKSSNSREEVEMKKKEKEKRLLLGGTVTVNLITFYFSSFDDNILNQIWGVFLPTETADTVAYFIKMIPAPICSLFNGSGALFIHIACSKKYREAFKQTWMGKLFSKQKRRRASSVMPETFGVSPRPRGI